MDFSSIFASEALGTGILALLKAGVVANVVLGKSKGSDGGWLLISFGWGIGVFAGVYVAYKTGGHLNPAVTIGNLSATSDRASPTRCCPPAAGRTTRCRNGFRPASARAARTAGSSRRAPATPSAPASRAPTGAMPGCPCWVPSSAARSRAWSPSSTCSHPLPRRPIDLGRRRMSVGLVSFRGTSS
ncbi:aquaporin [Nocardia tengchongensis]|uniref:aquaporin n=1 Tax=Nocardia tengchongensis TaxID=2055889 RepID=UPI00364D7F5C